MRNAIIMLCIVLTYAVNSQTTVQVDPEEIRFLGNESELDRGKFFNYHGYTGPTGDGDLLRFNSDFNVGFGRQFWGPFGFRNQRYGYGNYPAYTPGTTDNSVRKVSRYVATGAPATVMRYSDDLNQAADWAIEYWTDVVDETGRPEFWEPMNEPFVHSDDDIYSAEQADAGLVRERMADWFNTLAARVKATPELANMKMIGYSSAWPSMELWDFGHWRSRMKMFIDRAGANMDAISVHPYDGVNITGQNNNRSGSNSEAILDLIETYTAQKFGAPKNLAITEFGIIERNYPDTYSDAESAISIKGINHMIFNFMERQDNIAITIPFITPKSAWYYNSPRTKPYVPALFRPVDLSDLSKGYVYSYKINFFEFWKEVKGTRTFISSDNPDIQVQSFLNGSNLFIAINNLDDVPQPINLDMLAGSTDISNVQIKRLKVFVDTDPSYTISNETALPSSINIDNGESILLKIQYNSPIAVNKKITRTKYYGEVTSTTPGTNAPVFNIQANVDNIFEFSGVNKGADGTALLRLGVGRASTYTNLPSRVTVNGTLVTIPTNWPGDAQSNRSEFFGVIKIPVPFSEIKDGINIVAVTYPDTGDQIASLILEVENRDSNCNNTWYADTDADGLGDPASSITSCGKPDGYVENANDTDPANHVNGLKILPVPGRVQAQDFNVQSGLTIFDITDAETGDQFLGQTRDGDFSQYTLNVAEAGNYEITFRVASADPSGGTIKIINQGELIGQVDVGNTGGWRTFTTTAPVAISLPKGNSTFRLEYEGPGALFNTNWFELKPQALSITDLSVSNFTMFPNPAKNQLYITGLRQSRKFILTDVSGRILKTLHLQKQRNVIDISELSTGLYIITDQNTGFNKRFVKK